jgi:hypothetical protein
MPWLPDFLNAAELARKQTRAAGQADPVGQYLAALNAGDTHPLEDAWPGEVVVFDPRAGKVQGHRDLRHLVRYSHTLLAEYDARVETVASTVAPGRAVLELIVHLTEDGRERPWPLAVVADAEGDDAMIFRTYFTRRVVEGHRFDRPPILGGGATRPGDVVGRHQDALAAGDADAVLATFEPTGYLREPLSPAEVHRGRAELRPYYERRLGGGIRMDFCAVTDDGVRCALEYNCMRWEGHDQPPQAGLAIYERGPDGLLAAVRLYDDLDA